MFCSLDSRIYNIIYTSYIMLLLKYTRTSLMTSDMTLIVQVMSFFFLTNTKEPNFRRLYIQTDPGFFPARSHAKELIKAGNWTPFCTLEFKGCRFQFPFRCFLCFLKGIVSSNLLFWCGISPENDALIFSRRSDCENPRYRKYKKWMPWDTIFKS